ncbi:hypothetical protein HGI86_005156 [Escherichia coli]|nr:hypothetical protein [Escherichia coli]
MPSLLPGMKAPYHGWLAIVGVIMFWDLALIYGIDIIKKNVAGKSQAQRIKIFLQFIIPIIGTIVLARGLVISFY